MTAAELRPRRFDELLESRINTFSVRAITREDAVRADERARRYDRAAKRHQLWVGRLLQSSHAQA